MLSKPGIAKRVAVALCVAAAIVLVAGSAHAAPQWSTKKVGSVGDSVTDGWLALSESHLVWIGGPSENIIYVRDLATGANKALVSTTGSFQYVGTGGHWVTYREIGVTAENIYWLHDIVSGKRQVTADEPIWDGARIAYATSNSVVVWDLARGTKKTITTTDGLSGFSGDKLLLSDKVGYKVRSITTGAITRISVPASWDTLHDFEGSYLIGTPFPWTHVQYYNPSTKALRSVPRATTTTLQQTPSMWRNYVLYCDDRAGAWDVYMYNINTKSEKSFSPGGASDFFPQRRLNRVAWYNNSNGVYLSELMGATTALSLNPSATTVTYNGSATLSGSLRDAGAGFGVAGKTVTIYRSTDAKTWTKLTSVKTSSTGSYRYPTKLTRSYYYRARFAGDAYFAAKTSASRLVKAQVYLTAPSAPTTVYHAKAFKSSGYLKPKHTAGTYPVSIRCYRWSKKADGTYGWVYKKKVAAKAANYSTFTKYTASITLPTSGKWRFRAYHAADSRNAATYSAYRNRTVK